MKKKVLKVVNPEIGIELYNLLISHQLFTDNIKAVAAAYNLLKQMAYKQHKENDCWFKHYSKAIELHFRNYTNGNYCQFLKALKELQLIDYDENGYQYHKDKSVKGDCRQYLLSANCLRLLKESNREWLKKLNTDKIIMRKTQKSISQRKVYSKKYNEPIFDYIHDGLININYDYIDAERMFNKCCWSDNQQISVTNYLADFRNKTFKNLERDLKTGRVFQPELNMKSGARVILKYKEQKYVGVLDIRSCYPTFFSSIILLHASDTNKNPFGMLKEHSDKLNEEHKKWVNIFTSKTTEPKEVIMKACGYENTDKAKAAMNQSINGSSLYPEFNLWLKNEFPNIFNYWQTQMTIKDTGNAIGREYESKLILDINVFEMADKFDIKLMPEADGYGVFSDKEWNNEELQSNLNSIRDYIETNGLKRFGVPVILNSKSVFDWTNADLIWEMTFKKKEFEKEYEKWQETYSKARKDYFSTPQNRKDKNKQRKMYNLKDKEKPLLQRYKDVINYWAEWNKVNSPLVNPFNADNSW